MAPRRFDVSGVPVTDRGPAMQIFSGKMFYPLDPRPDEININDIAEHLSKINRYTGATAEPLSVAQHSVLVERIYQYLNPESSPAERMAVLLHDAAEAYIGDISRPVKVALEARAPGVLAEIEARVLAAIYERFDLSAPPSAALKLADNIALQMERRDFLAPCAEEWPDLPAPLPWRLFPQDATEAYFGFLDRFEQLEGARDDAA